MTFHIEKTFLPSTGVDIVFNMSSLSPYSRSSIIYDVDYEKREITIAQPLTPFSKRTEYEELHLTTVIHDKNRKLRAGVACTHLKLLDRFPLANRSIVSAVKIRYKPPIQEINIRSAFRLPLSKKYIIKSKLVVDSLEYVSPKDYIIRDISLTGMGVVIPKQRGDRINPLTALKLNQTLHIGVILINMDQEKPYGTLPIKATTARINQNYSETHILAGFNISALKPAHETILNKFIHEAQVDELKRLSGRT